jgi:CHAD domain-containing protein
LKKERLQKKFRKKWGALLTHLQNFSKKQESQEIHQMRIEIKKIIAITTLAESCAKGLDFSGPLKPIISLFKRAGKLRDGFVHLELINRFQKSNATLKNEQGSQIKKLSDRFCLEIRAYEKDLKNSGKKILFKFKGLKNNCILHLYQKQLNKLIRSFSDRSNPMDLHKCRKKIKTILYGYEVFNKGLLKELPLNTDYLERIQDKIGRWHDLAMTMKVLADEGFADNQTVNKLKAQNERLIRSINTSTNNFQKKVTIPVK